MYIHRDTKIKNKSTPHILQDREFKRAHIYTYNFMNVVQKSLYLWTLVSLEKKKATV